MSNHLSKYDSLLDALIDEKAMITPATAMIQDDVIFTDPSLPEGLPAEVIFTGVRTDIVTIPNNQIKYYSYEQLTFDTSSAVSNYGASITGHTWSNNVGVITFSDNVTKVGGSDFNNSRLYYVILPRTVETLGAEVFKNSSISHLKLNHVKNIEATALNGLSNLRSLYLSPSLVSFGRNELNLLYIKFAGTRDEFSNLANTEGFSLGTTVFCSDGNLVYGEACLAAGTKISMATGLQKKIEDIKLGDQVLAFNDGNLIETTVGWRMYPVKVNSYAKITLDNGTVVCVNAPSGKSHCHRFLSTSGKYENAENLVNKSVVLSNGKTGKIISVEIIDRPTTLYNIITTGTLNYIANGVVSASGFANSVNTTSAKRNFSSIDTKWDTLLNASYSDRPEEEIANYIDKLSKEGELL